MFPTSRNRFLLMLLVCLIISTLAAPVATFAQGSSDNPAPTASAPLIILPSDQNGNAPDVVIVAPVATDVRQVNAGTTESTDALPDNPRGVPSWEAVWAIVQPYAIMIGVIALIVILTLFTAVIYLAVQYIPPWMRPLVPMGLAAGDKGVQMIKDVLIATPSPLDDPLGEELGKSWDETKKRVQEELDAMVERSKQQLAAQSLSSPQSGQGLVEYALILVLVAVVVIVIMALLGPTIGNIFSNLVHNL